MAESEGFEPSAPCGVGRLANAILSPPDTFHLIDDAVDALNLFDSRDFVARAVLRLHDDFGTCDSLQRRGRDNRKFFESIILLERDGIEIHVYHLIMVADDCQRKW
jgi:hypothetical protein